MQVGESHKFHAYHWLMHFYSNRLLAINLCRLVLGGQTVKKLCPNLSSTKVNTSPRNLLQADASPCKRVAKQNASWTQVQNLCRLASPFGQGFRDHLLSSPYCTSTTACKLAGEDWPWSMLVIFEDPMSWTCSTLLHVSLIMVVFFSGSLVERVVIEWVLCWFAGFVSGLGIEPAKKV